MLTIIITWHKKIETNKHQILPKFQIFIGYTVWKWNFLVHEKLKFQTKNNLYAIRFTV